MEDRIFNSGDIVRHFKRETVSPESDEYLYMIVGEATHTETHERFMVYSALYGDGAMFVRPLEMFMSEVDREKYPEIKQKYRFELEERAE